MTRLRAGDLWFEWDAAKAKANFQKHGLDFRDAPGMFTGNLFTAPDVREDYGDERWVGIGEAHGRVLVLIFAQPAPGTVRVISLRKATRKERKYYEQTLQDGLEED